MANTFTLKSDAYKGRYLELTCVQTRNISQNTSTIKWTLTSTGGSAGYYYTGPTSVYINGERVYYKDRVSSGFPAHPGSTNGTIVITHNADGTKSIPVKFSTAIYYAGSSAKTYSGNWTLDSNPRGAEISKITTFTDELMPTITYTNYAGTAASILELYIYDEAVENRLIGPKALDISGTTYDLTLAPSELDVLYEASKNTDKLPVQFYLRTVIDGEEYWRPFKTNFGIVEALPFCELDYWEPNERLAQITDSEYEIIQHVGSLQYEINAEPMKKATIVSYSITVGNQTKTTRTGVFENVYIEYNTITFSVVDSRGFTYVEDYIVPTNDYLLLTCKQEAGIRLEGETGAIIRLTLSGNYFDDLIGPTENALQLWYRIKEQNQSNWGEWVAINSSEAETYTINDNKYKCVYDITGLSYDKTYTVQAKATDVIFIADEKTTTESVLTLMPVFDWGKEDFNFNVPVKIKGVVLDYIVEQSTKDGWTYRKWNSGQAECWKILNHTTTLNSQWGNSGIYIGTPTARQSYPFTFTEKPVEIVNLLGSNSAGWMFVESAGNGMNGQYQSAVYNIARPTPSGETSTFNFAFYVKGKWK